MLDFSFISKRFLQWFRIPALFVCDPSSTFLAALKKTCVWLPTYLPFLIESCHLEQSILAKFWTLIDRLCLFSGWNTAPTSWKPFWASWSNAAWRAGHTRSCSYVEQSPWLRRCCRRGKHSALYIEGSGFESCLVVALMNGGNGEGVASSLKWVELEYLGQTKRLVEMCYSNLLAAVSPRFKGFNFTISCFTLNSAF